MVSAVSSAFQHAIAPITKLFSGPDIQMPSVNIPPPPNPASQPSSKPQRAGMQQSFLSGAAAAQLPGQGSSSSGGKTLLGQ